MEFINESLTDYINQFDAIKTTSFIIWVATIAVVIIMIGIESLFKWGLIR